MLNKNTLEAIKFIVDNGGSDYYSNLLKNQETINYKEEISDIKRLFEVWLEEFDWSLEEATFMRNYIEKINRLFEVCLERI